MKTHSFTFRLFIFLLVLTFLQFSVYSQARDDFYDPYDFNLRNYKGGEGVGQDYDYYKDYSLPPKTKKPPLVSPKSPQVPVDPMSILPIPGGIRSTVQQNQAQKTHLFNPLTGSINFEVLKKNQEEAKIKKEREKKQREAFERREPYTESKSRRFEIIFFMTFPFALALTYIIASLRKFQKTAKGTAFVGLGSIGLSLLNAYSDRSRFEEHEKNKKQEPDKFEPDYDKGDLSWNETGKKNFQVYVLLGEKNF